MQKTQSRYTGAFPIWGSHAMQGHCSRCGEPSAACCCGCRECRKEAKELLVTPQSAQKGTAVLGAVAGAGANDAPGQGAAKAEAFIGGGCCVSLSVEYAPETPTGTFLVELIVRDSDGTTMAWARSEAAGAGYQVREGIITTKPGAKLLALALNCTARVRWCEVFSC